MSVDPALFRKLDWRNVGPPRGGRVVAVAGDPVDPAVFYFGACAGGVWKTDDGGTYWRNVSDGFFRTAAVGAIAVAPSNPQVVWAGTGESCVRNDVSHGDGVYRSVNGGLSWEHLGLEETRHISRVRVHPQHSNVAWVAALGDIFGPSRERGVYRTRDGGATWEHVLFRSERAGAADLWLDPSNPRLLYAALWDAERKPWEMRSGGEDSSLYRSTDGGDTWTDITRRPGLPKALLGRIGVAASPAKSSRVWALVEAADDEAGLYRSDDGGEQWRRISEDPALLGRPWYYSHIVPDPLNPEVLYGMNFAFHRSTDGGRSFHSISTPHGDNHDLWIDPADPRRMIEGNDGGACVSYNRGDSFSTIYNQPTGQFYHVAVDNRFPYRIYGTQQDNSAISVPSRSRKGAIVWNDCYECGHSESGHIVVDPTNDDVVFSGAVGSSGGGGGPLLRYDHATEQIHHVTIWPEHYFGEDMDAQKHRFQWTFPISFSPHDPNTLYACGERVFRSTDHGQSWESISPDLTRADPEKLKASGGPINKDTSGAEIYCTVFAFAESPLEAGLLWAGTDDGCVHLSRDAGSSWKRVTPPELGDWTTVATLEPSPHDPAHAYLAAHRYRFQDRAPYLFKTEDYGATWRRITNGIPTDDFTRVIRADPVRPGLLYAGTETAAYVSLDDGASWQSLGAKLPVVPIYDLVLKDADLVAASHGRGFWVLDDVTPLRELPERLGDAPVVLFSPPPAVRYPTPPGTLRPLPGKTYLTGPAMEVRNEPDGTKSNVFLDAGQNPRDGVTLWYHLAEPRTDGDLELDFRDPDGNEIIRFFGKPADGVDAPENPRRPRGQRDWQVVPGEAGLQHFTWDLRSSGFRAPPDAKGQVKERTGYLVPPGTYTAVLRVGEHRADVRFEVRADPRGRASKEDLEAQYDLLIRVRDLRTAVSDALTRTRKLRAQLGAWKRRKDLADDLAAHVKRTNEALGAVEDKLTQTSWTHDTDRLKLPAGLDAKLEDLPAAIAGFDARPTRQAEDVFAKHAALARETFAELDRVVAEELPEFERRVREAGLPIVDTNLDPDAIRP